MGLAMDSIHLEAQHMLAHRNLDKGLTFYRFKFLERFRPGTDTEAFLLDFFKSKAVKDVFGVSHLQSDIGHPSYHRRPRVRAPRKPMSKQERYAYNTHLWVALGLEGSPQCGL
jgi:hypothetical protein